MTIGAIRTSRPRRAPIGVAVGSLLVIGGAALPWGGSGRRDRSGFELTRLARRLDVLDGLAAGAARLWALAPLVLAGVLVAAGARRPGVAIPLALLLAVGGAALVVAVHRSPLVPRAGLHVTAAGAAVVLLSVLWRLVAAIASSRRAAA